MPANTPERFEDPGTLTTALLWVSGVEAAALVADRIGFAFLPFSAFTAISRLVYYAALVAVAVLLPLWTMCCRTNAALLRPGSQQYRRVIVGWCWFIPVFCLWQPFQAVNDAWHAGTRDGKGAWIVELWWYARLASWVAFIASPYQLPELVWVALVLRLVSLGAFVRLARQLSGWQREDITFRFHQARSAFASAGV